MHPLPGGHHNQAQTEKKDMQAQVLNKRRRADTGGMNSPHDGFSEEKVHLKSHNADELTREKVSPCRGTVDDDNTCDYASNLDLPAMTKVKQSIVSVEDQHH